MENEKKRELCGLRIMRWYGIILFVLSCGPIWMGKGVVIGAFGLLCGVVFICLSIVPKEDEEESEKPDSKNDGGS